ncbi:MULTISPECIES: hypothetical protein [Bacillaceae]|nr:MULTISPECIES: hypothetical protein [Bacillaceae]MEC5273644.1 hypothetical protein [Caldifermentibacillus hisashii]UZH05449.1 hypothetical protein ONG97_10980 [Heyndrickxia coagulans]
MTISQGTSKKRKKGKKKKRGIEHIRPKKQFVNYHCLMCHEEEKIPYEVVREMDLMDGGDPITPPRFQCEKCNGVMVPEYYKGIYGTEYKLTDYL